MDALALLQAVGETYAKLASFEVELRCTVESGDDDASSRSSTRARAFFVAPNKVRIEQCGRRGMVTVTDGADVHNYFRAMKQYSIRAVPSSRPCAGMFQPEHPLAGGTTFLFHRIGEGVAHAETLRDEDGARMICVTYDPPRPGFVISNSPVTYCIDLRTNLVSRMEGEVTHRIRPNDEEHTSRNTCSYTRVFVNQAIPLQTFEYAPPAGATDPSDARPGGRSWYDGPDENKRFETWRQSNWEQEAFVDQFELKARGLSLNFDRRVTFADQKINVSEKITGPRGSTERAFSIKVAE